VQTELINEFNQINLLPNSNCSMNQSFLKASRLWALGVLGALGMGTASATHIAGTDLTYAAVPGVPGAYLISLKLYRDCGGIQAPTSPPIKITSAGCSTLTLNLALNSVTEVSDVCSGVATECDSIPGTAPGIEEYIYTSLWQVPATTTCSNWTFSYEDCCRNSTIINVGADDPFYTRAFLNSTGGISNSSPVYTINPVPYFCINDTVTYSPQATDPDGDSLVFSLAPALQDYQQNNTPTAIPYNPGYTYLDPFGTAATFPTTLDAQTGLLRFKANQLGPFVLVIKIDEYRNIGGVATLVGSCQRDVQVQVMSCTTPCPLFGNVISTGSGTFVNSNAHLAVHPGTNMQVGIPAYSTNQNVTLTMTSNCAAEIPGSSFTASGAGANVTGNFTWTPTSADVRATPYYFTYEVTDNACPIPNQAYAAMRVLVTNGVLGTPEVATSQVIIPNVLSAGQSWTLPADLQGAQVNVFDATGKEVYSSASYANHFTGKNLSNGVYLFRITPKGATSPITGQLSLQQ
jgi:hypothetical protein